MKHSLSFLKSYKAKYCPLNITWRHLKLIQTFTKDMLYSPHETLCIILEHMCGMWVEWMMECTVLIAIIVHSYQVREKNSSLILSLTFQDLSTCKLGWWWWLLFCQMLSFKHRGIGQMCDKLVCRCLKEPMGDIRPWFGILGKRGNHWFWFRSNKNLSCCTNVINYWVVCKERMRGDRQGKGQPQESHKTVSWTRANGILLLGKLTRCDVTLAWEKSYPAG